SADPASFAGDRNQLDLSPLLAPNDLQGAVGTQRGAKPATPARIFIYQRGDDRLDRHYFPGQGDGGARRRAERLRHRFANGGRIVRISAQINAVGCKVERFELYVSFQKKLVRIDRYPKQLGYCFVVPACHKRGGKDDQVLRQRDFTPEQIMIYDHLSLLYFGRAGGIVFYKN